MNDDFNFNPARPKQRQNYMLTNFVSNYDDLGRASIEQMIKQVDSQQIDFLEKSESEGIIQKIAKYLNLSNPLEWIFLVFFAIAISIVIIVLDRVILIGIEKRLLLTTFSSPILSFLSWVISAIFLFLLATSVGYFISADADGSGIPEMKTVLSGINIYRYFSFNAFIGKILGLFAALVGGASVGKVGPYVHISCLICNRLMKINYFSKINKSTSSKNNMLAAAAAAGITLALGTPLGGVLFSIESTASIYIVSNIWKSFFCSVICIFVAKLLQSSQIIMLADIIGSKALPFSSEVFLFILEGFLGGIIGALISTFVAKIVYIRRKSKIPFLNNRFRYAVIIAIITSVTTFIVKPLKFTDKAIMNFTFSSSDGKVIDAMTHPGEGAYLFLTFFLKFTLSVLCLTCNIPAGVFGPIFCIGALFGRTYGHLIKIIFDLSEESIYAMVGAACVFSGATHSVSSALIIFEMTGQTSYLAPLLLATLIANMTAQSLSMSLFDVLLVIKNLPHLPSLKSPQTYSLSSNEIMNKVNYFLEIDKLTMVNAMTVLSKLPKKYNFSIPILDENGTIRYTVLPKNLFKYMHKCYEQSKLSYNVRNQSNFNEYFAYIKRKFFSLKRSFFDQVQYKFRKLYITIRDKEKLKLNKNFEEESNMRLLTIFKESILKKIIFRRC
jgi:chloride channel 2